MMFLTLLACSLLLCIGGTGWPDEGCGRSRVHRGARYVYKGRPAKDGEFPWMVSVHSSTRERTIECGGSLIKENIVLTAAHCMEGFLKGYIAAGYLDKRKRGPHYQRRKIRKVVSHKGYKGSRHDIALIKLARPFNLTESKKRIGTVCLPKMNRAVGKTVTITGWGLTTPSYGSASSRLLAITVPVRKDKFCKGFYPWLFNRKIMFCAGKYGRRSAKGDSGGPGVEKIGRKSVQVGIESFGNRTTLRVPGFQTKVSAYSDWIADKLKMLE